MATKSKERFDAAVQVIHSLPKDGPFQPSYDMMLTFYGLFKQATEGTCTKAKPWSWDIVAKKKWDAWSKLGEMSKEKAMDLYVEQLKKTIAMSTDKWKTMSEKEKTIVEAMPQEKPVRDFMETIGSFYELIDEKSPFEDEQHKYQRMNGKTNSSVVQADLEIDDDSVQGSGDMNHSLMVDPMLKNMVKQNIKMNGMPNGFGDRDFEDDVQTESALSLLDTERDNWDKISSQMNDLNYNENGQENDIHEDQDQNENERAEIQNQRGNRETSETVYDNLEHPINGETLTRVNVVVNDKVTSESDSDEEFCDTSDQPSPEDLSKMPSKDQHMSTPLHGTEDQLTNKQKNRVHFSANPALRTDVEISQQTLSPIPQRLQHREKISMASNFPFGLNVSQRSPHDSLTVHGPSQDSLNVSGISELDNSPENSTSSVQSNEFSNRDVALDKRISSENLRSRGGGQISPPGGSSSGNLPSKGTFSSHGFRADQGYGYYEGYPPERGPGGSGGGGRDPPYQPQTYASVNEQIALTLLRLQQDMHTVLLRLNSLESASRQQSSRWWPFPDLSGRTFLFVVIWPMVVYWFLSRKRRER